MNPSAYTRPNKPTRVHVKRRTDKTVQPVDVPQVVAVDRATECHVTPADVAARMVEYLDAPPDAVTLEPSAGTGNLVQALIDSGHFKSCIITVEQHAQLSALMAERFTHSIARHGCDFLEYKGMPFDRVLMNPPFRQVKQHVAHALGMLKAGGVLVALVPITFQHPRAETLENLPVDTFSAAKVYTKIIRII